jgi:soluble lytic murein transglycosylase-like protein
LSFGRSGLAAVLVLLGAPSGRLVAAEPLFYEAASGRVVVTNTPSSEARPLPGFKAPVRHGSAGRLPATIYDPFIHALAEETGVAPTLIKAVAFVESNLDPHAVSPKGAQGLMQLMPATAAVYGVEDAFDPLQNLRAGALHLRAQLEAFGGDVTLALAAYNAGAEAVRRHGGVPAYPETQEYVRRVKERLGRSSTSPPAPGARRARPPAKEIRVLRRQDGSILLAN